MDNSNTAAEIIAAHERDVARIRAALRGIGVVLFVAGFVTMAVALALAAIELAP